MSFFDEADEPPAAPRPTARSRRPTRGRHRPPRDQQAIQTRRIIAAAGIVVLLILIVLGVHSCQISARNSAMKDYTNNVSSLIQRSDQTGAQLFTQLSAGGGGDPTALQNQVNQTRMRGDTQLNRARDLSVPDEMRSAHQNFLLTMQMRRDGLTDIARQIQPALGTSASTDAVDAIATDMARFYASDVVYKAYTTPQIASALHGAGISIGGGNGVQIEAGQFVPDLQWLTPSFVAAKLGATAGGKPAAGLHGHTLTSVSVGGIALQTGSTNTVPAKPAPTFKLSLTNGGTNAERNVVCKVNVTGSSASGRTVIPQTTAGESTTCSVKLSSVAPSGSYTVTASVQPVPGEKNTDNNTLKFPVTFQ